MQNRWVKGKQNVIITGPTGSGKTFIACALANSACRSGHSTYYIRLPRLLQELHIARGDGSYGKLLTRLAKYTILVIDDWGLAKLGDKERRDILEVLEDRHGITSTIVASQIPTEKWHDAIGDPTIADAVLDRLRGQTQVDVDIRLALLEQGLRGVRLLQRQVLQVHALDVEHGGGGGVGHGEAFVRGRQNSPRLSGAGT